MRLANRVDHACRALMAMSSSRAEQIPLTVPDIATETSFPAPYLMQIQSQVRVLVS